MFTNMRSHKQANRTNMKFDAYITILYVFVVMFFNFEALQSKHQVAMVVEGQQEVLGSMDAKCPGATQKRETN